MKRVLFLILLAALLIPPFASRIGAIDLKRTSAVAARPASDDFAVSIKLIGETGDVYGAGEPIQISFQTTKDAYVVIYNIDADGYVHLLYPENGRSMLSEGRKTYFLPPPGKNERWETGATTGIEYIHAVAVTESGRINEDELYFLSSEEGRFRVDSDPFLSFNMIDEELVHGAKRDPPATDHVHFCVNRRVEYPRFLCSRCHSQEKLSDPYAMECPEIVIEKISYSEKPRYPYSAQYDIQHVGEEAYASDRYADDWLEEDDRESESDDVHLRISLAYGGYYPAYRSWPYYGPTLLAFDPFYWDPFWWDVGWYWSWGSWYWWPGYSWWYSPFHWAHHYRYPWWGWHNHCWACDGDWGWGHHRRPIYGTRTVQKRLLDYTRTAADVRRARSIEGTRLEQVKSRSVAQRLERSTLGRRVTTGTIKRTQLRTDDRSVRSRETSRSVIYGSDRSKRSVERSNDRVLRTRITDRTGKSVGSRSGDVRKTDKVLRAPQKREKPERDVIRRSAPERKSSDRGRKESTREGSKSVDRNRSSVEKRSASDRPSQTIRSYQRNSSPAPARASGSSGNSARSAAKTSSSPATTKSRSR